MSTAQVPGHVAANNDHLHTGCWAERDTPTGRALLYVDRIDTNDDGTGVVHYSEMTEGSVTAAPRQSVMTIAGFNARYSDSGWTWHDKSPAPARPVASSTLHLRYARAE